MEKLKLLVLLVILPVLTYAQSGRPLTVTLSNEATAIPFTQFYTTPVHPGIFG